MELLSTLKGLTTVIIISFYKLFELHSNFWHIDENADYWNLLSFV